MDIYVNIVNSIIKEQTSIIGPLALSQARKVEGIGISDSNAITIRGDQKHVLEDLVHQYELLFGRASIEVCRDAVREVKPTIPNDMLPDILK